MRKNRGERGAHGDARAEIEDLRREVDRYRSVFDSARLVVGHELAKPLMAARGYLDLLEERRGDSFDERDRVYVANMRSSFARLDQLVETFVDLLRTEREAGAGEGVERIDLREFVENVRNRFEGTSDRISLNLPADPPAILAQRRCLDVVLENLVSNAVKHGGGRNITVTVALAKSDRDGPAGRLLTITVEDRGAGIPEDKIESVFAPFFRVESGRKQEGLGLGLALVKSVISAIEGEIRVRSKPGAGTAITVIVPVRSDDAPVLDAVR